MTIKIAIFLCGLIFGGTITSFALALCWADQYKHRAHWRKENDCPGGIHQYTCSRCGIMIRTDKPTEYCHNCGARMTNAHAEEFSDE